jgi:predicted RNA methylase
MIVQILALIFVILITVFMSISFYITIFGGGPFIPTPLKAVHSVLKHAKIKKGEKVYDIGAGDGRFIHFATKDYGAKATGFEMDPFVYFIAKIRQLFFSWKGKIIRSDFRKHSLKDADVIVCYMMPKTLAKFQIKFDKELKKGTRIISYAFHIGTWKAKKIVPKKGKIAKIFIYQIGNK